MNRSTIGCSAIQQKISLSSYLYTGTEINRVKRNFQDGQGRRGNSHLKGIHEELQGVQNIMFENIDAVLQRGELIESQSTSMLVL